MEAGHWSGEIRKEASSEPENPSVLVALVSTWISHVSHMKQLFSPWRIKSWGYLKKEGRNRGSRSLVFREIKEMET